MGTNALTRAPTSIIRLLPIAAAAATGVQVGSAIVATRFVIGQTAPASLALLRYAIALGFLLPVMLQSPRVRFERRDLLPIALLGMMQFGVLIGLLNYGLQTVSSVRAALIFGTFPLLTMILAAALGRERLSVTTTLGVLLTIVGVGLALGEKALERGGAPHQWIGELAVLGSALSGAVCSVLYRPYLRKYPTLAVSALAMLASLGFLAVLAAGEGFFTTWPHFTPTGWLAVVFIGASSGAGYFLWLWALNHTTPTRVAAFLALGPVTAAVLGTLLLGETMSVLVVVGLASVVLGLLLSNR